MQTRDERHGGVRAGVVDGDGVGGAHGEDDAVGEVKVVWNRLALLVACRGLGRWRRRRPGWPRRPAAARRRPPVRLADRSFRRDDPPGGRFAAPCSASTPVLRYRRREK